MPLKNYTTQVPADRSVSEIQAMLQAHGASGVLMEYERGTGRIDSLSFKMSLKDRDWAFRLPMRWREAKQAMIAEGNRRASRDDDYCYRVAWRITRDWVAIQMALVELHTVELQEIFLPYTLRGDGKTLYEHVVLNPSRLLGSGKEEQ